MRAFDPAGCITEKQEVRCCRLFRGGFGFDLVWWAVVPLVRPWKRARSPEQVGGHDLYYCESGSGASLGAKSVVSSRLPVVRQCLLAGCEEGTTVRCLAACLTGRAVSQGISAPAVGGECSEACVVCKPPAGQSPPTRDRREGAGGTEQDDPAQTSVTSHQSSDSEGKEPLGLLACFLKTEDRRLTTIF